MTRILLLGGTRDAHALAVALHRAGLDAVYSYAGRIETPRAVPIATRTGGFGGVAGLCAYIRDQAITHLVDATHPFAATISGAAVTAAARTGVALMALERPPWCPGAGDDWRMVGDVAGAVAALPAAPARVFLAIGRQNLGAFADKAQHHYLCRLVDPPAAPPLPDCTVIVSRGPFALADDRALMQRHGIQVVVAKNAGGDGARAKLDAARALGLPVIMIARPDVAARPVATSVDQVMAWLGHDAARGV